MKKEHRLKKADEIEKVLKKGESSANRTFIVYRYAQPTEKFRVAVSSPKKLGKAVVRNKVRRQIKAILTQNPHYLKPGYDYFIIARPSILNLSFLDIQKNIQHVFNVLDKNTEKNKTRKKGGNQS